MSKNPAAVALGRIKSARKAASSRENGSKGGRPAGSKDSTPRKRRKALKPNALKYEATDD